MQKSVAQRGAFTLVELIVAIVISVMLLGGIMYFITDILVIISRSNAHGKFLDEFYGLTTLLGKGDFQIIDDRDHFDVGLLVSPDGNESVLIGVITQTGSTLIDDETDFHIGRLAYSFLSFSQLQDIQSNTANIYTIPFQKDKIFENIIPYHLEFTRYNSGSVDIYDMGLQSLPIIDADFEGAAWENIPKNDIESYYFSF